MKYDLIIAGSGPAGLTAAVYAARYKLKTLVIGKLAGGLAGEAYEICNFPSYGKILGFELMQKMINQVKDLGVEIKAEEIIDAKNGKEFEIVTNKGKYFCKKLILATGSERKKLELAREKELTGRGISYCATCDAPFYKDKIVAVIGGSDAALTAALLLTKFAKKVYIIYRQDRFFRAEPTWIEDVKKNKKIEPVFNSVVKELAGEKNLEEIKIETNGKKKNLKVDGVFVEIGSSPNVLLAEMLGVNIDGGQIVVNKKQGTNVAGVFAAGDVTNNFLKQVVTACGEGAIAADSAYRELIE